MAAANPYLNFNGNTEEAFNFYKDVFGGDFQFVGRYKDMPAGDRQNFPTEDDKKIMHISLPLGPDSILMGSDIPEAFPKAIRGSNYYISLSTDNEEETARIFSALSADGIVAMPLDKTFWGAYFGMCVDKYGTQWMLSYDYK